LEVVVRARSVLSFLLLLVLLAAASVAFRRDATADDEKNDEVLEDHPCLQCHGFEGDDSGAPYVDGHGYLASAHAKHDVECTVCHESQEEVPHPKDEPVLTMQCGECHEEAFDKISQTHHKGLLGEADDAATTQACIGCHAVHALKPSCTACHEDAYEAAHDSIHLEVLGGGGGPQDPTACVACHGAHDKGAGCGECHEDVYDTLQESMHAPLLGEPGDARTTQTCQACHGTQHGVAKVDSREAPLYPLNVPNTCGNCHFEQKNPEGLTPEQIVREKYMDDTHGHALVFAGLITAPTCVSCHGGHEVLSHDDPRSAVHPDNVSKDCGKCHVGILEQYRESVHGRTKRGHADDNRNHREPATCTDCHQPHGIQAPDTHFKLRIIETCAGCHAEYGKTYKGTYHGRVSKIGFGGVASCDECHTAHRIQPTSDPRSSLSAQNRTATCARCHEGATKAFAGYLVHADPMDRQHYPVLYWARRLMRGLVFVTWALWGLHTLLWLFRALKERKHIKAALEPVSGRWYRRWPWPYRAIHLTLVFSFLLLALTGLPLRYPDAGWSRTIFTILGGPEAARFLHRTGAVLTFGYAAVFIGMILWRRLRGERGLFRGPNTLLPRLQDLRDMKANLRWFFKGGEMPKFDRWTYYEKWDFIAEVWGVLFIGITGLVMWYPMFFTEFLPGSAINLAHILHSYEALLATSFIFTIHFFNANLRPGKFPIDPMFLTGRISEEELRHERPMEYERMRLDGRLESEALPPPNPRLKRRAYVIGTTLLSVGILLLVSMIYAMVRYGIG